MKTMKTFKTTMIAAIILCGTSMNAQAQEQDYYFTNDEVAISIGGATNSQILGAFSDVFSAMGSVLVTSAMTGGQYSGYTSYDNEKTIPALSLEYFHHMSKTISIGGIIGFNGTSSDMYCTLQKNSGEKSKEKVGTSSRYFFTVMPAVKFDWVRKKNIGIYSKVAIGITYRSEKEKQDNQDGEKELYNDSGIMGNFQASLLGIEAGSQKCRGFVELGVGEQGIISGGFRYKF